MKILVFGASNHSASINAGLARLAADRLKTRFHLDAELSFVDLNEFEMPIYSLDREQAGGIPDLAQEFFAKIGASDALIISYAEYNGSYTSAWKNIHDWMSRIDMAIYQGKPLLALSATPGPLSGANVLGAVEKTAPFFGADLRGVVGVGNWMEGYNPDENALTRGEDVAAIDAGLENLVRPAAE